MILNINLVEDKIFLDKNMRENFPLFKKMFSQYDLAARSPLLSQLKKRTIIDFINNLDENDVDFIKSTFSNINIFEIENNKVKSTETNIEEIEDKLNSINPNYFQFNRINNKIKFIYF